MDYDPRMYESCVVLSPAGSVWKTPIPVAAGELDPANPTPRERWIDELVRRKWKEAKRW